MHPIGHGPEQQEGVAVGLVEVALLELLDNDLLLHSQRLGREGQTEHAVGLQPEGCLDVVRGCDRIVVGHVVAGPGIVLAPGFLERRVEVGDMDRTAEHEMLEEMGKASATGRLVFRPYIVQQVQRRHASRGVVVVYDAQTIGQYVTAEGYHLFLDFHFNDFDIGHRSVGGTGLDLLYLVDHVHALDYFAENGVFAIEMGSSAHGRIGLALGLGKGAFTLFLDLFFHLGDKGILQSLQSLHVAGLAHVQNLFTMSGGQRLEYRLFLLHLHLSLHLVELLRVEHLAGDNVELRPRRGLLGVDLIALPGSGQGSTFVKITRIDNFCGNGIPRIAQAQHLAGGGILGGTVATLYHELIDYPMEQGSVIISLVDQFHEIVTMCRSLVVKFYFDISQRSFHKDNRLLMSCRGTTHTNYY